MELEYYLDIAKDSLSFEHTPSLASQKLPFFVQGMGSFRAGSGYYTRREGLNNYLLIYTVSGSGIFIYRNMERTTGPAQAVLLDCNEKHFYKTGECGYWNLLWVHIGGVACEYYHELINEQSFNIVEILNITASIEEMFSLKRSGDPLADLKFSGILSNIINGMAVTKFSPINNPIFQQHSIIIDKVKGYIHGNYRSQISLDMLSAHVNVSKYHLLRLFKRHTGISPYEYIINYRINVSKNLLKEKGCNVGEAATESGYNDVNNFIRDFKKLVGTTPLKFKNYWIS